MSAPRWVSIVCGLCATREARDKLDGAPISGTDALRSREDGQREAAQPDTLTAIRDGPGHGSAGYEPPHGCLAYSTASPSTVNRNEPEVNDGERQRDSARVPRENRSRWLERGRKVPMRRVNLRRSKALVPRASSVRKARSITVAEIGTERVNATR